MITPNSGFTIEVFVSLLIGCIFVMTYRLCIEYIRRSVRFCTVNTSRLLTFNERYFTKWNVDVLYRQTVVWRVPAVQMNSRATCNYQRWQIRREGEPNFK